MTTTLHPLRIVSFGAGPYFLHPDVDDNIEVELRRPTRASDGAGNLVDGKEEVVDIAIPGSLLLALGAKAATSTTGKAVIGGSRRGGGITATVRTRRR